MLGEALAALQVANHAGLARRKAAPANKYASSWLFLKLGTHLKQKEETFWEALFVEAPKGNVGMN